MPAPRGSDCRHPLPAVAKAERYRRGGASSNCTVCERPCMQGCASASTRRTRPSSAREASRGGRRRHSRRAPQLTGQLCGPQHRRRGPCSQGRRCAGTPRGGDRSAAHSSGRRCGRSVCVAAATGGAGAQRHHHRMRRPPVHVRSGQQAEPLPLCPHLRPATAPSTAAGPSTAAALPAAAAPAEAAAPAAAHPATTAAPETAVDPAAESINRRLLLQRRQSLLRPCDGPPGTGRGWWSHCWG